jgi:hypothetical protein
MIHPVSSSAPYLLPIFRLDMPAAVSRSMSQILRGSVRSAGDHVQAGGRLDACLAELA